MSNLQNRRGAIIIEGHVQGLANTRALGEAGIPVVVVDKEECVASSSKYCNNFFLSPDFLTDEFIDFLIDLAQNKDLFGWTLIPSNDHAVFNISKNINIIKKYFKTTIPDLDIIGLIYDKSMLLKLAEKIKIPIPKTIYFEDAENISDCQLEYPLLTKGRTGLSFYQKMKKKALLADDKEKLSIQLREIAEKMPLNQTFTQELIPFDGTNKTISLAAFCIDGEIKTYWMGVKLREHPIQFGTATFTESVHIEDCLQHSKKILKKLNYSGVCEVEFLQDPRDQQYKLIEINARTWLWVGHAIASGINFPLYIHQYVNQIEIEYPKMYKQGLKWKNPITDLVYSFIAIIKGDMKLRNYLKNNQGEVVSALWDSKDKKPFFIYIKMIFKFLKNR